MFGLRPFLQQFRAAEDGAAKCFHMTAGLERDVREAGVVPCTSVVRGMMGGTF